MLLLDSFNFKLFLLSFLRDQIVSIKAIFHLKDECSNYRDLLIIFDWLQMGERTSKNSKSKRMFRPYAHFFRIQVTQSYRNSLPISAQLPQFALFSLG